jgi:hypothetical protein
MAREGSLKERGRSPLSKSLPVKAGRLRGVKPLFFFLPLSNKKPLEHKIITCLRGGRG